MDVNEYGHTKEQVRAAIARLLEAERNERRKQDLAGANEIGRKPYVPASLSDAEKLAIITAEFEPRGGEAAMGLLRAAEAWEPRLRITK